MGVYLRRDGRESGCFSRPQASRATGLLTRFNMTAPSVVQRCESVETSAQKLYSSGFPAVGGVQELSLVVLFLRFTLPLQRWHDDWQSRLSGFRPVNEVNVRKAVNWRFGYTAHNGPKESQMQVDPRPLASGRSFALPQLSRSRLSPSASHLSKGQGALGLKGVSPGFSKPTLYQQYDIIDHT